MYHHHQPSQFGGWQNQNQMSEMCQIRDLTGVVNASALRGMILRKMKLREIKGRDGPKEVFTFILRDESDSICVSCWGPLASSYHEINEGDLVVIRNPEVKERTQWSLKNLSTSSNFELHVSEEKGGEVTIQRNHHDFPKEFLLRMPLKVHCDVLEIVKRMNTNEQANVCGVAVQVLDLQQFSRKDKSMGTSRSIYLSDGSLNPNESQVMKLIFWDEDSEQAGRVVQGDIIFVENAKITCYREERGLTFGASSVLYVNPPIGIADSISNWWRSNRGKVQVPAQPQKGPSQGGGREPHEIKVFLPIRDFLEQCYTGNGMVFCNVVASLSNIGIYNATYTACTMCKKTFYDDFNRCSDDECTSSDYVWAWKASITFIDDTGSVECAMFGDVANNFFGMEAQEFEPLSKRQKEDFEIQRRWNRYRVCVKGSAGPGKLRATVLAIDTVNYQEAMLNMFPDTFPMD